MRIIREILTAAQPRKDRTGGEPPPPPGSRLSRLPAHQSRRPSHGGLPGPLWVFAARAPRTRGAQNPPILLESRGLGLRVFVGPNIPVVLFAPAPKGRVLFAPVPKGRVLFNPDPKVRGEKQDTIRRAAEVSCAWHVIRVDPGGLPRRPTAACTGHPDTYLIYGHADKTDLAQQSPGISPVSLSLSRLRCR